MIKIFLASRREGASEGSQEDQVASHAPASSRPSGGVLHLFIAASLVALGALLPYVFLGDGGVQDLDGDAVDQGIMPVSWKDLQRYDYKRGLLPAEVRHKISHPVVQMAGFAVPLQTTSSAMDHFLFVPSQAYCIHVPPPPPHLMIEVKMKGKQLMRTRTLRGALLLTGQLQLKQSQTTFGQASWYFEGKRLEPYRPRR